MTAYEVPTDASSGLRCRLFEDQDLPGILRLWESQSGWGGLTAEMWKSWYRGTPYGDAIVTVTLDERDEVVGQMVFTPAVVRVDERKVSAYRMSAPILASTLRTIAVWKATHPFAWMYLTGLNEAIARGGEILYAFPAHKWLAVWSKWKADGVLPGRPVDVDFGCLSLTVVESAREPTVNKPVIVSRVTEPIAEHEQLWEVARSAGPRRCAVERSLGWLRYNRGEGISLEARRVSDGVLAGYAVVKRDGLLSEFVVAEPLETEDVLEAILDFLGRMRKSDGQGLGSLSIMDTPELGPSARALGATAVDFRFAFICSLLAESVPETALDPDSWQLMPGD